MDLLSGLCQGLYREDRRVANGFYFYRLDAPEYRNVKKAVMMR